MLDEGHFSPAGLHMKKTIWFPVVLASTIAIGTIFGTATRVPAQATGSANAVHSTKTPKTREGAKLTNRTGSFRITGDRVTFYAKDDKQRFRALENLALERIARVISDSEDPGRMEWSVSGKITEYHGNNYLLVSRAVLKAFSADGS